MILLQGHAPVAVYLLLWGLFFVGEVWLSLRRRATGSRAREDRGFLSKAWLVFLLSNFVAVACLLFRFATFGSAETSSVGLALLMVGLLLRWWSIACLGRLFTVDVAIAADHQVIDSGPYRILRHPSYLGHYSRLSASVCASAITSLPRPATRIATTCCVRNGSFRGFIDGGHRSRFENGGRLGYDIFVISYEYH
jgi:protein-S-isoprenylcysteine O-methyltransferase